MKVSRLSDHREKKEGIISPRTLADDLAHAIDQGDVEEVVAFTVHKDGSIKAGWSTMNTLRALGLIEVGKDIVKEALED